jgi:AraC-like DNA-binding protein
LKGNGESGSAEADWTEKPAWRHFPDGWKPLFGRIADGGVSIEWHDFKTGKPFEWGESFHPNSVEVCLNLEGEGTITHGGATSRLAPSTIGVYVRGEEPLSAIRAPRQQHRFVTLEFTPEFLKTHLTDDRTDLSPVLAPVFQKGKFKAGLGSVTLMNSRQKQFVTHLLNPPVMKAAQGLWYQGKVLEFMAEVFFAGAEEDFFCSRQKRVSRERVEKAMEILRDQLESPPTLQELGRQVGCSQFYLSRTFSQEMGMTIAQFIRQIRIEKAAELLLSGDYNVTEAALEVGYNSISHFSQAFCQLMGSCPTLYPSQQAARSKAAARVSAAE